MSEHASAFTHGDVVRGIKAGGGEVAKGSNSTSFVERAYGIAAVLDYPEVVFGSQLHNRIDVKRIAEGMRQHDGFGAAGDSCFELRYIDVVSRKLNVDEDRDESVLKNRIDSCRKSGSYGDDFVSGGEFAIAERG